MGSVVTTNNGLVRDRSQSYDGRANLTLYWSGYRIYDEEDWWDACSK